MENMFVSQRGLFWNKLGKWQVLAVILTLSVFSFISITGEFGDKISTTAIAAFIAFGLTVFTFSIYYGNATSAFVFAAFAVTAIAVVVFSTAFDCAAFVTAFATAFDLDFAFVPAAVSFGSLQIAVELIKRTVKTPIEMRVNAEDESSGKRRVIVGKASGKILDACRETPSITIPEMSAKIGITERSVQRNLQKLQADGFLRRVGGRKEGRWEVIESNEG